MLEAIAENIWIVDGSEVGFHGFAYPTRMIIIRLANGDAWI